MPRTKGSRDTLKKGKPSISKKQNDFCMEIVYRGSVRQAAIKCKIGIAWAYELWRRPEIQAHIGTLRAKILDADVQKSFKTRLATVDFVDEQLMDVAANAKKAPHARVQAGEVLLKSLGMIQTGTHVTQNQNQIQAAGNNAFQVYEAKWLRERKAAMSLELEQKYPELVAAKTTDVP